MHEWELFAEEAKKMGLLADEKCLHSLQQFTKELLRVNAVMNITAITQLEDIVSKHYLDSLSPLITGHFSEGAKVMDVGSGGGFPGVVLKIARNDLKMTFLDSQKKRITFLEDTGQLLGLSGCEYLHKRAEDGGKDEKLRESFDIAVSRAVATLPVLCEWCLPYVRVGGKFIAMKGPEPKEEVERAKAAISLLGGRLLDIKETVFWNETIRHSLIVIEKVEKTNKNYPRAYKKMMSSPL